MTEFVKKPYVRSSLWFAWFVCPIAVVAWHFGPGQNQYARDIAGDHLDLGSEAAARQKFATSADSYSAAISTIPDDDHDARDRLQLEHARVRIQAGEMVEGQEQLQKLLEDLESRGNLSSELATSARNELATATYYAAWLMRLEGATVEEWKPEAERARQQFRLLAEQHGGNGPESGLQFQKNLEATIRLEQMDLDVLMAKPLPKNCPCNCKNLSQRKRKQCQSRCKSGDKKKDGKGKKKQRQDARQQIKQQRGAGLNQTGGTGS